MWLIDNKLQQTHCTQEAYKVVIKVVIKSSY